MISRTQPRASFPRHFRRAEDAFSLVEVVIAIAVCTIGLISILALFGVSFSAVRDVTNQEEASGIVQALPAYLQTAGFSTVYGSLQSGTTTSVYAYATNSCVVMDTNGSGAMAPANVALRSGRLFCINLALSTNAPVSLATNSTSAAYLTTGTAALPSSSGPASLGYGDAYLPINVKVYSVSQVPALPAQTNFLPVLSYDTVLTR